MLTWAARAGASDEQNQLADPRGHTDEDEDDPAHGEPPLIDSHYGRVPRVEEQDPGGSLALDPLARDRGER